MQEFLQVEWQGELRAAERAYSPCRAEYVEPSGEQCWGFGRLLGPATAQKVAAVEVECSL